MPRRQTPFRIMMKLNTIYREKMDGIGICFNEYVIEILLLYYILHIVLHIFGTWINVVIKEATRAR